jgi:uncharacterized protein (DUF486 family)
VVAFQADVIKYMLEKPILSVRIGKWAYALIEYDLAYESLRVMIDQVIADFIFGHKTMRKILFLLVFAVKILF